MDNMGQDTSTFAFHPPPDQLLAFGLGKLDVDECSTIADHISSCDTCRLLVEAVTNDSLAGLFRRADDRRRAGGPDDPKGEANGRVVSPSGYEVLEVLGEGGMGVVYKARQIKLDRLVALKQLRPEALAGDGSVARFHQEAEAVARLNHDHIVPIFDSGLWSGIPFYSMEFVKGGTLAARLAAGPLDPMTAARLVETLAQAMHHAHETRVVHRDLKPSNVLLAPDLEHAKISDFGLAKLDNDATRTRSGVILGTPSYMAPEQAEGDSARVGRSADVYALGVILYETLTGQPPFRAPTVLETMELVRTKEPIPPRRFRGEISRDLETITLKCLEKSPERRYSSAQALADDLNRLLKGEPIFARPISRPERLAKWAKRRPWQAISAALGILIPVVVVAGTLISNARLRAQVVQTEKQYHSARTAIQRMLDRFDEPGYANRPLAEKLRRQLLEDALVFYEGAVRDYEPTEFAGRLDKVAALRELARFQIELGKPDEALPTSRRALTLLDALEAERPDNLDVAQERINVLVKLAIANANAKRIDEAAAVYQEAIERAERASRLNPDSLGLEDALAWVHHNLGCLLHDAGKLREADPYLSKAAEIRRRLLQKTRPADPYHSDLKFRLAENLTNLGVNQMTLDKHGPAEAVYAEAAKLLDSLVKAQPDNRAWMLAMGKLYRSWGTNERSPGRFDRAIERYRAGLETVDALLLAVPDWPEARKIARDLNVALADTLGKNGRHREAVDAWDRALALDDGEMRLAIRLHRACCLANAGDAPQALAEAEAYAAERHTVDGSDRYNVACIASLAAKSFEKSGSLDRAEAAADRAIRWLTQARDAGFFRELGQFKDFEGDHDLDYLRSRRDFQRLRLDAAFPADPWSPRPSSSTSPPAPSTRG